MAGTPVSTFLREPNWEKSGNEAPAFNGYDFECITKGGLLVVIAWIGPGRFNLPHDKTSDSWIEQNLGHTHKCNYLND